MFNLTLNIITLFLITFISLLIIFNIFYLLKRFNKIYYNLNINDNKKYFNLFL